MLRCNKILLHCKIILAIALLSTAAQAKKKVIKTKPVPVAAPAPEPAPEPAPAAAPAPPPEPAPVATPAPPPAPPPPVEKPPEKPSADLEALNAEYLAIRDELFRSRAKAELIGSALFKTRMVATFRYRAGRAWPLRKVTLRLDDQPVYSADAPNAEEAVRVYEGFTVPGKHTLVLRVECSAQGETRVAYGAEGTFVIDVPDGKQSRVAFDVDETGDGPQPLAKKHAGEFSVHLHADVKVLEKDAK
jgi:hypothetical protein